jgi:gamma-glutamylcyclotransferase
MRYFAYGSNMNPERMLGRDVSFHHAAPATLLNFELAFNKVCSASKGEGYANIVNKKGAVTLGVLYDINYAGLRTLDLYEGYPLHYGRRQMYVYVGERKFKTWVYYAQQGMVGKGLKPSPLYLSHLISGAARYLPKEYFDYLRSLECN